MAWLLNAPDSLALKITATVAVSIMAIGELLSAPTPLKTKSYLIWFAAGTVVTLILVIGVERDWLVVSFNAAIMFLVLPAYFLIWFWIRGNWFLMTGLILSIVVMMIFWLIFLTQNDAQFEFLLLPLLFVMSGGILWAPVAVSVLENARLRKDGRISGPGWQALAMGTLFLPVTLVTIAVPPMLNLGDIWYAASLTILSVLLGAVISDPLRRLFIEWGKLDPDAN